MTTKVDPAESQRQGISPPTERVVAVVELLGANPDGQFTLAEICRRVQISRATGHVILTTLAAHDWVTRDPVTAAYSWGPAIASLANPTDTHRCRDDLQALAAATGTQVHLSRRQGRTLVIDQTAGNCSTGPRIGPGLRTPLVAPFGREYVAWAAPDVQRAWLEAIGQPSPALRRRMTSILREIRTRGFAVERLTTEYLRVYTALRALTGDGEVDAITAQLARAFADLTVIDVLPDELGAKASHNVAIISAPITDATGAVTMSVTAAVFTTVDSARIRMLGQQVSRTAHNIEARIAGYPPAAP
ncbi:helix-turn-helix domain-containing protein [Mycolicibacterium sphagni]|uniref:helix-turn-helix domain-containing protein n=1 Tax=Mycolicibacterium sphagni TaxID=1786 RepID=UPI0021F29DBB|nr:helix-turn-helix domain-containing protein [Mycolicibacterium sphagni]MCV7179470.1 helix-turn-helix domain-containing protein [Mycolicibacterium sphagni]